MGIAEFLERFIHNSALVTFLVAMIPVLELRASIPVGVALGLHPLAAYGLSVLGNLVPVPFIIIFIRRIFTWMQKRGGWMGRVVDWLEAHAAKKSETVQKWAFWGLVILVAIPLPGTGAWTGSLVAAMLDMPLKKAFPAIAVGVVGAGIIVAFVTYGAGALLFS